MDHEKFVVISGCSGGGKSTLLAELARRGHAVVEEPGRRIVIEELKTGGSALPWLDMKAFVQRAVAVSLADLAAAGANSGWVFFDRGLTRLQRCNFFLGHRAHIGVGFGQLQVNVYGAG